MRVVRDADHIPAARGEVRLQAVQVHGGLGPGPDGGDHDDGAAHQVAVLVGLQPVEGGARAAGAVDRG